MRLNVFEVFEGFYVLKFLKFFISFLLFVKNSYLLAATVIPSVKNSL